ncbi:hypothetical protein M5K25_003916 [Dendrobium thyrsiflorum]|uniref:Uncharacterized protein n=1 Tax=Dendrobium thyrsiflorum TaxID=117978 RepID=A0ABD0VSP2_DENTH
MNSSSHQPSASPIHEPLEGQDEHDPTNPTIQVSQIAIVEDDSLQGSSTDPIQNELFKIQILMYLVDTKFDKKVRKIRANLEREKKMINDKYAAMIQELTQSSTKVSNSSSSGDESFQALGFLLGSSSPWLGSSPLLAGFDPLYWLFRSLNAGFDPMELPLRFLPWLPVPWLKCKAFNVLFILLWSTSTSSPKAEIMKHSVGLSLLPIPAASSDSREQPQTDPEFASSPTVELFSISTNLYPSQRQTCASSTPVVKADYIKALTHDPSYFYRTRTCIRSPCRPYILLKLSIYTEPVGFLSHCRIRFEISSPVPTSHHSKPSDLLGPQRERERGREEPTFTSFAAVRRRSFDNIPVGIAQSLLRPLCCRSTS